MTYPSISKPAKILLIVLYVIVSFCVVMAAENLMTKVSAQASQTASCDIKIYKDACKAKVVSECRGKTGSAKVECERAVIARYQNGPAASNGGTTTKDGNTTKDGSTTKDSGSTKDADDPADPANDKLLSPRAASNTSAEGHKCGNAQAGDQVKTRFNFGCIGDNGPAGMGPIEDMIYAIIRFLSYGIGIVLVIAMIISGLQYSASEGNAEASQAAKSRIQNVIVGLFLYLISFSLLQYLVPGGVFAGTVFTVDLIINNLGIVRNG